MLNKQYYLEKVVLDVVTTQLRQAQPPISKLRYDAYQFVSFHVVANMTMKFSAISIPRPYFRIS